MKYKTVGALKRPERFEEQNNILKGTQYFEQ